MRTRRLSLALVLLGALLVLASAVPAFGAANSGYAAWTSGPPNDTSLATPHKDFATTTTKCAVCHSVHKASETGEMLLQSSAAESCTFCHITTDIGGIVIYGGQLSRYTTDDEHGHQSPAVTCIDCHAVHGANTFGGEASVKILKVWNIQQTFVDYMASGETSAIVNAVWSDVWPGEWDTEQVQDAAFCTQCHPYYSDASETEVTADVVQSDGTFQTMTFNTHPMKKPGGEGGNPYYEGFIAQGSSIPTTQTAAVYSSRGCNWNCHWTQDGGKDRGIGTWDNSYPHHNPETARFLAGGENSLTRDGTVTVSNQDSACLMCHRWVAGTHGPPNDGDGGVGVTY